MGANASRAPLATYRVQLSADFGFDRAAAIADYVAALGVSHLYASPYLLATEGSTHGYDITAHSQVSVDRGGDAARRRMNRALRAQGLAQVLDIVPNHMAADPQRNVLWADVLKNGRVSRSGSFFDIDWEPPEPKLWHKVLVPVLGGHYGDILEGGGFSLRREGAAVTLHYEDHAFPVAPESLAPLLDEAATRARSGTLAFFARAFDELPSEPDGDRVAARQRDVGVLETQLGRLLEEDADLAAAVDDILAEVERNAEWMDALLQRQHYRLAYWRLADREINYRRFFTIETLVGIRVEERAVFDHTHRLVLRWLRHGDIDALRVDHVDGLRDPLTYLQRLRHGAGDAWIVVEKILEEGEALPEAWPVQGTTGYDFLNEVAGLFVDPNGERPLTALYREFTGEKVPYREIVHRCKVDVIVGSFGGELDQLVARLMAASRRRRRYRDVSRQEARAALIELIAALPVYRTYMRGETGARGVAAAVTGANEADTAVIEGALAEARRRRPNLDERLWEFLRQVLLEGDDANETEFTMRFQQLTSAAMAKGVEDTAYYVFHRLVSLNEVGGDPERFGVSPEAFHGFCRRLQERWPETLLTTSTHDTKRGEDVRARINLLSEIPGRWREAVWRWFEMNDPFRRDGMPDRNTEYLLYQTLVGAWPIDEERLQAYALKAAREAKQHTAWTRPNPAYEEALAAWINRVLQNGAFVADLEAFLAPLIEPARMNGLAQTLIKHVAPGVPDLYQGTELWDLSLVDPDNRRPVDYDRRRAMLEELERMSLEDALARSDEGFPKMLVIRRALQVRRLHPECFGAEGAYRELAADGERAAHVVAFARGDGVVAIVPRLVIGLAGRWGDTALELPPGRWANAFTGEEASGAVRLEEVLRRFPVALLTRLDDATAAGGEEAV